MSDTDPDSHRRKPATRPRKDKGTGLGAYLLMALFVVLTACTGLYLNRKLMDIYNASVQDNLSWTARLKKLGELAKLSCDVSASAIDIFDAKQGQDVVGPMIATMDRMDQRLAAERAALAEEAARPRADKALFGMLERLDRVIAAQDSINDEVQEILQSFRTGHRDEANARAASMNRKLAGLQRALEDLRSNVHDIQHDHLDQQQGRAKALAHSTYLVAGLILLMVICVALYGIRVSREARRSAEERERNMAAISRRNDDMRLVLDNVNQGLLTLDLKGTMEKERSAVIGRWLGAMPAGEVFWRALLPLAPTVAAAFPSAWESLMDDVLPLELALEQMPHRLDVGDLSLRLDYVPIFAKDGTGPAAPGDNGQDDGKMSKLLLVVSDITSQIAQAKAEAEQREILTVFEKIMANKTAFLAFFNDASSLVSAVCGGQELDRVTLKRQVHTLKGNCAAYGLGSIAAICHAAEERMKETGAGMSPPDRELLGAAWAAFSHKLARLIEQDGPPLIEIERHEHERVVQALADGLPRQEILDTIAAWQSQPVKGRLFAFAEQIKELGKRLDKGQVTVEVDAEGLRLPAERFARFWGAFTHVVRNAVDHGLETPTERADAGKDDRPKIVLAARVDEKQQQVVIEVRDNGRGVNWARLGKKAAERGLPHTTHEDLVAALFADGVSTHDVATETSGRGVGMAAVREEVDSLGGQIKVDSEPGVGTTFQFRFPRTLLVPGQRALPSIPLSVMRPVQLS